MVCTCAWRVHGVHVRMACTCAWRARAHGVHVRMACTCAWRARAHGVHVPFERPADPVCVRPAHLSSGQFEQSLRQPSCPLLARSEEGLRLLKEAVIVQARAHLQTTRGIARKSAQMEHGASRGRLATDRGAELAKADRVAFRLGEEGEERARDVEGAVCADEPKQLHEVTTSHAAC